MDIEALGEAWQEFRETGDLEARNQLIVHYAPLVRTVAHKVAVGLPAHVDRDDLVSFGTFGLIEVLSSYDPDRAVKFETFATPRIRGSILDALRKLDPVSRSVRSKVRDIESARAELQIEMGREPSDQEIAMQLGMSVHELWSLQGQAHAALLSSLDEDGSSDDPASARVSVSETLYDISSRPEDIFEVSEITELMAEAINTMPERHKQILVLYYIEEMTLAQIGEVLGVTESRVCQLQSKVLVSLREALGQGVLAAA